MLRNIRVAKMVDFEVGTRMMKIELDQVRALSGFTKSEQTQKTLVTFDCYHLKTNRTFIQHLS